MLPRITVVTPSFNQGQFLEETIQSVLAQGYPRLEYIIIDGGSKDSSVDIIKKYQDKLAYWTSEPDKGQTDALNKGFAKASGDIFCWLNSDDILNRDALNIVGRLFQRHPDIGFIYGDRYKIDTVSKKISSVSYYVHLPGQFRFRNPVAQESAFWRKEVYLKAGSLDPELRFCMDYDLWCRLARITKVLYVPYRFGSFRQHSDSKTHNLRAVAAAEKKIIKNRYFGGEPHKITALFFNVFLAITRKFFFLFGVNKLRRSLYGIHDNA